MPSKADEIMDVLVNILNKDGYVLEDIHLIDYDTWQFMAKDMKRALREKNLDLSFTQEYSENYNIKLGGNVDGIVNDFRWYYYKKHPKFSWSVIRLSEDIIDSANEFYRANNYSYPVKINKEQFMKLVNSKNEGARHIGIGSQAHIDITTVRVYADSQNNLMYNEDVLVYD